MKRSLESSDAAYLVDHELAAAMATLLRVQPKDFKIVKREWAAIRFQTVFMGFLARRALKPLVRVQAIFRGRRVRKQAGVTLRYAGTCSCPISSSSTESRTRLIGRTTS